MHRRHEILKANKRDQPEIEKICANSALQTLPVNQQMNLRQHLASINADLLALTRKGSINESRHKSVSQEAYL